MSDTTMFMIAFSSSPKFGNAETQCQQSRHICIDLTLLQIILLVEPEVKTLLFMTTLLGQCICCACITLPWFTGHNTNPEQKSTHWSRSLVTQGNDGADDIKIDQWHETSSLSSALVADFLRSSGKRARPWRQMGTTKKKHGLLSLLPIFGYRHVTCIYSVSSKVWRLLWTVRNVFDDDVR